MYHLRIINLKTTWEKTNLNLIDLKRNKHNRACKTIVKFRDKEQTRKQQKEFGTKLFIYWKPNCASLIGYSKYEIREKL